MRLRRREFITLVGGAAAAWPLAARAQQPAMVVIGFLGSGGTQSEQHLVAAFRDGLAEAGYVAGKNVFVALQAAEGRYDRLPMPAADFISQNVALLAAGGPPAALAAKAATST